MYFPFYVECIASDQTGSEQADCNADRPFHPAFSGKYMEPFIKEHFWYEKANKGTRNQKYKKWCCHTCSVIKEQAGKKVGKTKSANQWKHTAKTRVQPAKSNHITGTFQRPLLIKYISKNIKYHGCYAIQTDQDSTTLTETRDAVLSPFVYLLDHVSLNWSMNNDFTAVDQINMQGGMLIGLYCIAAKYGKCIK